MRGGSVPWIEGKGRHPLPPRPTARIEEVETRARTEPLSRLPAKGTFYTRFAEVGKTESDITTGRPARCRAVLGRQRRKSLPARRATTARGPPSPLLLLLRLRRGKSPSRSSKSLPLPRRRTHAVAPGPGRAPEMTVHLWLRLLALGCALLDAGAGTCGRRPFRGRAGLAGGSGSGQKENGWRAGPRRREGRRERPGRGRGGRGGWRGAGHAGSVQKGTVFGAENQDLGGKPWIFVSHPREGEGPSRLSPENCATVSV